MDTETLPALAQRLDLVAVLVFALVSGARGAWVFGHVFRAAIADRDDWKKIAMSGTSIADRTVAAMEKK